jgi:hypothetical protein
MEKRFIFRQLLAIYDCKLSDAETRHLILDLLLRVCQSSKYALIDLIKKQFLLVWMTSVVQCVQQGKQLNQTEISLFFKLLKIYNAIWLQLGKSDASSPPPITFLNQMYILVRLFLLKLAENNRRLIEFDLDEWTELGSLAKGSGRHSSQAREEIGEHKKDLKSLFRVNRELVGAIKRYELNLATGQETTLSGLFAGYLSQQNDHDASSFRAMLSCVVKTKRKSENDHSKTTTTTTRSCRSPDEEWGNKKFKTI